MEGIQGTVEVQVGKVLFGKLDLDKLGRKQGNEGVVEFSLGHGVEEGVEQVLGQKGSMVEEEEAAVVLVDMVACDLCDSHQTVDKKK